MTKKRVKFPHLKKAHADRQAWVRHFGVGLLVLLLTGSFFSAVSGSVRAAPAKQVDTDTPPPTTTLTETETLPPPTFTATVTLTPTSTLTITHTATITLTPTLTPTRTATGPTPTFTRTRTKTLTPTRTATGPTPTITRTRTKTLTPTHTATGPTLTPTVTPTPRIIINEVAWAGTTANPVHEWIEFYNPGSVVNLTGWTLTIINQTSSNPPIIIPLGTSPINQILLPGRYYLLEKNQVTTNVPSSQIAPTLNLLNSGNLLILKNALGQQIDTANIQGGAWPAGRASPNKCSMERASTTAADMDGGWFTNNNTPPRRNGLDAGGNPICGTPGRVNWAYFVTATPTTQPTITLTPTITSTKTISKTPTKSRTPTKSLTPTPRPLEVSSVVINEFLVQPRFDWNQDGKINSGDAFIEIKNLSTISVSVSGWYLDDQNGDSSPYYLPAVALEPGARKVYFASETNIILSEASDSVRLFKPGAISDVYTYTGGVKVPNQSWCRLPDSNDFSKLAWTFGCQPTPELTNMLAQTIIVNNQSELAICLSKTIPRVVYDAECLSSGLAVWSPLYWLGALQTDYPLYIQRDDQLDILE